MSGFAFPFQVVMAGHSPFEKRAFFRTPYVPAIHAMISRRTAWKHGTRPGMTVSVMAEV